MVVVARPRGNPKCDGASRPTRRGTGCPFGTVVLACGVGPNAAAVPSTTTGESSSSPALLRLLLWFFYLFPSSSRLEKKEETCWIPFLLLHAGIRVFWHVYVLYVAFPSASIVHYSPSASCFRVETCATEIMSQSTP